MPIHYQSSKACQTEYQRVRLGELTESDQEDFLLNLVRSYIRLQSCYFINSPELQ